MADQSNLPKPDNPSQQLPDPIFRFHLLGELQVVHQGQQIAPPPFRARSLLAALLLNPHPQRRDRLVGLLFPDTAEHMGRRRLSDILWLLRQSLPELRLDTDAQAIFLPPECRWLDIEAFRQAAAQPDLQDWQRALALYRGDLLEGVYDDWLLTERETLYLHYLHLSHRACDELLRRQQMDDLLPLAERLVQAEPYDEKALRTLMQAYRTVGRRGAALALFDRFLALAADELGAEPEPATRALAESVRYADTRTRSHPAPLVADDDSPGTTLRQAREALARGDRASVEGLLRRLRSHPGHSEEGVCLLEVDLALLFEEYDRAARVLKACDARQGQVLVRIARLAQERRQASAAHDAASAALIRAHETGDRQTEMEAVLALAFAQRQLGQSVQAARSAEQALSLARACASTEGIVRALTMKGHSHLRQGQYVEALSVYHEARSVAHEHSLRCCLGDALHQIAWIQSYQGALVASLATAQEALNIWRDLGVTGREASTLQNLAYTLAQLGRTAESLRALEQASRICEQLGEPVRVAVNQYHLADTMLYHDDALAVQAIAITQAALATFRAHDQPGWEAATLSTEGHAQLIAEQHAAALDTFCRAYALYEQLEELAFLPELLACQGLAYLGLGQPEQALDCTRRALLALAQGEVSDEAIPEIYYAHAMALTASGKQEQARDYLGRAYQNLLAAAAQLDEEAARQAFFHHNPATRRLMKRVYAQGVAPAPASGVISRQLPAAHSGRPMQVAWTVDAGPADAALKQAQGAIALRRARLSRLLHEAQAQGATPTVTQLAEALGISKRTAQRDLAALRCTQETD
jgi:DNA-binding SARP family transcriptional activator